MAIFVPSSPWTSRPVLVCDHCKEEIKTARDLFVRWDITGPDDEDGLMFYFLHRKCRVLFEASQLWAMLSNASVVKHLKVTVADWWH